MGEEDGDSVAESGKFVCDEADWLDVPVYRVRGHYYEWLGGGHGVGLGW